ncbi:MAG: hypothetical protein M1837_000621 [Sclerophora amabilis]|nr:MAG: hypothetical protein M1837_000621 [Sclerophora amabilis]
MAAPQHSEQADVINLQLPIDPALFRGDETEQSRPDALHHGDDDLEWEYEYDTSETETFYLTLDLTSSHGPLKSSRKRKASEVDHSPDQEQGAQSTRSMSHEIARADEDGAPNSKSTDVSDRSHRIQILDLHSPNPIISFENRIYSCQWASNLGTELLFTSPASQPDLPKLRSTSKFDLLAASSFRLTSTPAQLIARNDAPKNGNEDTSQGAGADQPGNPIRIPVGPRANRARRDQARFLERLMAVKDAQGETDEVTVFAKKKWLGTGWRTQTRLRKEAEREDLNARKANGDEEAERLLAEMDGDMERRETTEAEGHEVEQVASAQEEDMPRTTRGRARGRGRPSRRRGRKPRGGGNSQSTVDHST